MQTHTHCGAFRSQSYLFTCYTLSTYSHQTLIINNNVELPTLLMRAVAYEKSYLIANDIKKYFESTKCLTCAT